MLILGIESSAKTSSIAVLQDETIAAEVTTETKFFHSETCLEHIAFALTTAGAAKKDLTGIAVNIGPGSFTGLRIGLATAKAMAYALDVPMVGVPCAEVLARGLWGVSGKICALIDAQKSSAYTQSFRFLGGKLQSLGQMQILPLKEIAANLTDEPTVLVGDIAKKFFATANLPPNVLLAPPDKLMPRAASVALLGKERLTCDESDDVMLTEPMYLRRSEAEILWDKRHGTDL